MLDKIALMMRLSAVLSVMGIVLAACGSSAAYPTFAAGTGAEPTRTPEARAMMATMGATAGADAGMAMGSTAEATTMTAPAAATGVAALATAGKITPNQVGIGNFQFTPRTLTVKAGTTVTWTNHDDIRHTVTATDKRYGSGAIDTDGTFSHQFTMPGTYTYFCSIHPFMTGTIVVQ